MARIRAKDTAPEMAMRRALTAAGFRYRLHVQTPGGKADIAVSTKRVAVFVDGCFWHGCPLHYVRPRSRDAYWRRKLRTNVERDRRQIAALHAAGWVGVRIWEHEIQEEPEVALARIFEALCGGGSSFDDWRVVRVEVVDPDRDLERRHLERLNSAGSQRIEERVRVTRSRGGRTRGPAAAELPGVEMGQRRSAR